MKLIGGFFLAFTAISLRILTVAPIDTGSAIVAISVYVLAGILFLSAVRANRNWPLTVAFTNDVPGHLITTGPYRYVRHPFYSSYCFTWIAGAVATHSSVLFVTFAFMCLMYAWAARFEEGKFISSELAAEYVQYRIRTGMFLPKVQSLYDQLRTQSGQRSGAQ